MNVDTITFFGDGENDSFFHDSKVSKYNGMNLNFFLLEKNPKKIRKHQKYECEYEEDTEDILIKKTKLGMDSSLIFFNFLRTVMNLDFFFDFVVFVITRWIKEKPFLLNVFLIQSEMKMGKKRISYLLENLRLQRINHFFLMEKNENLIFSFFFSSKKIIFYFIILNKKPNNFGIGIIFFENLLSAQILNSIVNYKNHLRIKLIKLLGPSEVYLIKKKILFFNSIIEFKRNSTHNFFDLIIIILFKHFGNLRLHGHYFIDFFFYFEIIFWVFCYFNWRFSFQITPTLFFPKSYTIHLPNTLLPSNNIEVVTKKNDKIQNNLYIRPFNQDVFLLQIKPVCHISKVHFQMFQNKNDKNHLSLKKKIHILFQDFVLSMEKERPKLRNILCPNSIFSLKVSKKREKIILHCNDHSKDTYFSSKLFLKFSGHLKASDKVTSLSNCYKKKKLFLNFLNCTIDIKNFKKKLSSCFLNIKFRMNDGIVCADSKCSKILTFFAKRVQCNVCNGFFCIKHASHCLYVDRIEDKSQNEINFVSNICNVCVKVINQSSYNKFESVLNNDCINSLEFLKSSNSKQNDLDKKIYKLSNDKKSFIFGFSNDSTDNKKLRYDHVSFNWDWSSF